VKTENVSDLVITVDGAVTVQVAITSDGNSANSTSCQIAEGSNTCTIALKDLLTDTGAYTIVIKAVDAAGNEATFPYSITVKTAFCLGSWHGFERLLCLFGVPGYGPAVAGGTWGCVH